MNDKTTSASTDVDEVLANTEYKYGWKTLIDAEVLPKGLNEDVIRAISAKKKEPECMLDFRLKA